jgi:flagellin
MSSINTNVTAMAAIRSLTMINNSMAKTQASIESGLRINKANDDPAVFSIAQGMRADLKGLTAVTDGLAFGKATLTVARDAATKISNELNTLKQTVTQGQQQGLDKATMNKQVQNLLNNMRSFAETATFNGVNLLNNSASGDRELRVLRDITGNTINVGNQGIISDVATGSRLLNLTNLDVDQGAIRLTPPATVNPQNEGTLADVNQVTVRMATGTTNAAGEAIYKEFVFEFNNDDDALLNVAGTTSVDVNGDGNNDEIQRTVIAVNIGNSTSLTPQAELGRLVDAMKANGIGARVNTDGTLDIFGAGIDLVAFRIEAGATDMVGALQRRYDTNGLATNAWDVGNYNLTSQAFTAGAGAGQYARVIGGSASDGTATQTTPDNTTTEFTNASSAIAVVDEAIRSVNTIVAELGARLSQVEGQQEFTKQLTDSIKEGLGALVDADLAEESARLTSLQTKQQLAIQSLSIANQQGQALLGLFR